MMILILIIWYLIGSIGTGYMAYQIDPEITSRDVVFLLTIGGLSGPIGLLVGLLYQKQNKY